MTAEPLTADRVQTAWARIDPVSLRRVQDAGFVAHNIPLSPTLCTRPGEPLIADSPRTQAIHDCLRRFVAPPLAGKTALDLGCLEGGLSFELWRSGLNVLGVEARKDNYERCLLVRDHFRADGEMEFVQADVREFRPGRRFDVVVCSGLLYHLDDPVAYLGQLADLTAPGGLLYLDTHVAPQDADLAACAFAPHLSPLRERALDGFTIRWREYAEDVTQPESSVGNTVSLWLDADAHVELLIRAGFERVFELHGYFGRGDMALKRQYTRRAWAALRKA